MRIWSLNLSYLDSRGLVALWRESLLAKKVLSGSTIGYKNHPQLNRFKKCKKPISAMDHYLYLVFQESLKRGFKFNRDKFIKADPVKIDVTRGQVEYEFFHLLNKLKVRDRSRYESLKELIPDANSMFNIVPGEIEEWEVIP